MSLAAVKNPRAGMALTLRDGLARLRAWRDERKLLHVHFMRNFATGAMTTVSLQAEISAVDEQSIRLEFEGGALGSILAGAEIFDGPMTFIDVAAKTREDFEAVQLRLRGGDSLLLSTREIGETQLGKLASRLRLPGPAKDEWGR